jgi:lipopolysaccharide export LptBFGC system permease protein LptF
VRIIDRYIGKQVLSATTFAVVVLSIVLVLGNIFRELLDQLVQRPDLDIGYVIQFVMNVLPFSLIFTIPWGFLTAVLLVFGRLSADNELISLRMAGLSAFRISASVFALALALSALSYWLNVSVAPKAQKEMKEMIVDMVTEDPLIFFAEDEVVDMFPGYIILVKSKERSEETGEWELRQMQLIEIDDSKRAVRYIDAERVTVERKEIDGEVLIELMLHNAHIENKAPDDPKNLQAVTPVHGDIIPVSISLEEFQKKHRRIRPSTMTVHELLVELREDDGLTEQLRAGYWTEINKRLSFSLASFTFCLVGIPLGVTAQRRETSIGFALSMMVACIYFLFILFADTFRDDPSAKAHLLMWVPNVAFIALGLWLFWRLNKR